MKYFEPLRLIIVKGMINWSQHFKHENPDFSITFKSIVQRLSDYFDLDVYATRLNFYPNNVSWKPFHHDSHAYGGRALREDFTVGASFGATRYELKFSHYVQHVHHLKAYHTVFESFDSMLLLITLLMNCFCPNHLYLSPVIICCEFTSVIAPHIHAAIYTTVITR